METATVQITKLPPSYRADLEFDQSERRFARSNRMPVSADFHAEGAVESPGLSFDDYSRMQTVTHKLATGSRSSKTPVWAVNDNLLRKVLVRYVEIRAYLWAPQAVTEQERLERAQAAITAKRPAMIAVLKKLCKEHSSLSQRWPLSPAEEERKQMLGIEIQGMDTVLRLDKDIVKIAIGCVFCFYRRGLNSVETGEQLGIKPPHVRAILLRLRTTWERIESGWVPNLGGSPPGRDRWPGKRKRKGKHSPHPHAASKAARLRAAVGIG